MTPDFAKIASAPVRSPGWSLTGAPEPDWVQNDTIVIMLTAANRDPNGVIVGGKFDENDQDVQFALRCVPGSCLRPDQSQASLSTYKITLKAPRGVSGLFSLGRRRIKRTRQRRVGRLRRGSRYRPTYHPRLSARQTITHQGRNGPGIVRLQGKCAPSWVALHLEGGWCPGMG